MQSGGFDETLQQFVTRRDTPKMRHALRAGRPPLFNLKTDRNTASISSICINFNIFSV
jgi:hypothetical protein